MDPIHLKVFLSSPGDLPEERAAARQLLAEIPRRHLLAGEITIDAVSWDDPLAPVPLEAGVRPQESVNEIKGKPQDCDLTLVLLWSRLGTPPGLLRPDGSSYESGTVWEYENARAAADPKVYVYFRTEPRAGATPQDVEAVRRFLEREFQAGGYNRYANPAEFRVLLEAHLEAFIKQRLDRVAPRLRGTPPARVQPDALPCLLDRATQDQQIDALIRTHPKAGAVRPIFAILPGGVRQAHDRYIHRLEHWTLPKVLAKYGLPREVRLRHLALRSNELGSLPEAIRSSLADAANAASDDDAVLARQLPKTGCGAVVVAYSLRTGEWTAEAGGILASMREYWRQFPDVATRPLLIFLLAVKFDDEERQRRGGWLARLRRAPDRDQAWSTAIQALTSGQDPRLTVRDLTELKAVTLGDIDLWLQFEEVAQFLRRHVSDDERAALLGAQESAPMDAVEQSLYSLLIEKARTQDGVPLH